MPCDNIAIKVDGLTLSVKNYQRAQRSIRSFIVNKNIVKSDTQCSSVRLLSDINIEICKGERVGLVGRNGSGKSTLLRVISGIYGGFDGSLFLSSKPYAVLELGSTINPELNAIENIRFAREIYKLKNTNLQDMVKEILIFAELEAEAYKPVKYYSSGMAAKFSFSLVTHFQPEILLLDEVFAAGDYVFIKKAMARMERLVQNSSVFIFVSHDLDLITSLCSRVIWLEKGIIRADGPADEVVSMYKGFFPSE